jgi:hypothetical protein
MKPSRTFLVLVIGIVSGFCVSLWGWQQTCTVQDGVPQELGKPFVTPLGVIPLQNGAPVKADLRNGFVQTPSSDPRFQTKFVVSLSVPDIQPFLRDLVPAILPAQAYAVLTHDQMGPNGEAREEYLTPFMERDRILPQLEPYWFRLVHDGTIGFGIGWYSPTRHEEVFINSKKIVTIMTSKTAVVEELLKEHGVEEFQEPRFITDYQTANGDLRSFADIYPETYGSFKSDEFLPQAYLPGLIRQLGFQKN